MFKICEPRQSCICFNSYMSVADMIQQDTKGVHVRAFLDCCLLVNVRAKSTLTEATPSIYSSPGRT